MVTPINANGAAQVRTKANRSANTKGQTTRLGAEAEQQVKTSDLLLDIARIRCRASVDAARSNFQALEAQLKRAREAAALAERDRVARLCREGIIAVAGHDRARSRNNRAVAPPRAGPTPANSSSQRR